MSLQLLPIELPQDIEYADLVVLSDMHVGDPLFDEQLFFRVRDWVLAEPSRYCILNGDLMNTATTGTSRALRGALTFGSTARGTKWR